MFESTIRQKKKWDQSFTSLDTSALKSSVRFGGEETGTKRIVTLEDKIPRIGTVQCLLYVSSITALYNPSFYLNNKNDTTTQEHSTCCMKTRWERFSSLGCYFCYSFLLLNGVLKCVANLLVHVQRFPLNPSYCETQFWAAMFGSRPLNFQTVFNRVFRVRCSSIIVVGSSLGCILRNMFMSQHKHENASAFRDLCGVWISHSPKYPFPVTRHVVDVKCFLCLLLPTMVLFFLALCSSVQNIRGLRSTVVPICFPHTVCKAMYGKATARRTEGYSSQSLWLPSFLLCMIYCDSSASTEYWTCLH